MPEPIEPGPQTRDAIIVNTAEMESVGPTDEKNNYLYDPDTQPQQFDAVHTLAIVSRVMTMYRRALKRMNIDR